MIRLSNPLTPRGWLGVLMAILALLIAVALIARWWDDLWDWLPWSSEQKLERAEARAEVAESAASARTIETQARAEQARRVEEVHEVIVDVRTATAAAVAQAEGAPDAANVIDPDRGERLRAHDRRLCELASASCADTPDG